jgi:2-polyprenyl-3-methyl-5-hydroxy-6-metoxy-1,4-benzoquinol methylase
MSSDTTPNDVAALTQESRAIWNAKAAFWDERMSEGNAFQRVLVGPATERLLALHDGELVLDVACGNGVMARRLAALGARIVACDFSEAFVELAMARTPAELGERIEYRVADATDEQQLLSLGEGRFDAAVCNMALMDMATIEPLLRAAHRLLKPDGRFVFCVTHPCFNTPDHRKLLEEEDRDGRLVVTASINIPHYLRASVSKGSGMPGEPEPHYYFHRSLTDLLSACFQAGFVLDGLEEPSFTTPLQSELLLNWGQFPDIPPVLAVRLRPRTL